MLQKYLLQLTLVKCNRSHRFWVIQQTLKWFI